MLCISLYANDIVNLFFLCAQEFQKLKAHPPYLGYFIDPAGINGENEGGARE